jgi:D-alanyl-D-alanine carboxypeptidase/D-alanyl-D-alanine-endopeptidase (penicillin-binding protein 4)
MRRWSSLLCAALTLGIATAHADSPRTPSRSSGIRRARAVSVPALRHRGDLASEAIGIGRESRTLESELIDELRKLESERALRRGTTAIYVVDASTGRTVYAVHEDEPLNPASNVKLISTATALDVLGPDWRYATRVLGPAPGPDGTVAGDLYLVGSYDPTLQPAHLAELAAALASAGVTRVLGDVVVGPDALRDSLGFARIDVRVQGRPPGQAGDATAPEVIIETSTGFLADDARAAFLAETFELDVQAQTTRKRRSRIDVAVSLVSAPRPRYRIQVTGTIGKDSRSRARRRLPEPQIYTAQLLRAALVQAGVTVQGAVREAALDAYVAETAAAASLPIELARHESQPLSRLVASINKRSLNALSDRVIMTAGAVLYGGAPTMDKGVRAMQAWLREQAGLDPSRIVLDSGSGLSYNTELTARQLVRVLRAAAGLWMPEPETSVASAPSMEELLPPRLARAADAPGVLAAGPGVALIGMLDDQAGPALASRAAGAPLLAAIEPMALSDDLELDEPEETDSVSDASAPEQMPASIEPAEDSPAAAPSGSAPAPVAAALPLASTPAEAFLGSLSVAGVDGTLRHRFHELRGQVQGKTGTLNKVVALSGLVRHGDQTLAFAIVTNGTDWRQRQRVRRQHERLVEALHRYLRKRAGDPATP